MAIYKETLEEAKQTISENWNSRMSKPNLFAFVQIEFGEKYMIDYTELHIRPGIEVIENLDHLIAAICTDDQNDSELDQSDFNSAAEEGNIRGVKALLESGADPNCNDSNGTPLHAAVAGNQPEIVRTLLNAGANIDSRELFQNGTALHMAAFRDNYSMVQLLVSSGADTTLQDSSGRTPIDLAKQCGNHEVLKVLSQKLISKGATGIPSINKDQDHIDKNSFGYKAGKLWVQIIRKFSN